MARHRILLGLVLLAALIGGVGWYKLFRQQPVTFAADLDNFKYGSVGVEAAAGLPFAVWAVLPEVFPDHVGAPGGYAAFGFIYEPSHDMPIGLPVEVVGFPRVGLNCGLCSEFPAEGADRRPEQHAGCATIFSFPVRGGI